MAFITVEGLEGAGKSTIIGTIKTFLNERGHEVRCTREPGGTPMAEAIRDCVKHDWSSEEVTQETELLLMYAARSQLVHNVIRPSLARGAYVIGDRHDLSSVAYQGGGRQVPLSTLASLKHLTLGDFEPDLVIYLDIDPLVGLARARGRGELDRIEQSGLAFFERARHAYKEAVNMLDGAITINAENDPDTVKADLLKALSTWYKKRNNDEAAQ